MQSFIIDFEGSPTFMRKWNKEFNVENLSENCFYVVLVDDVCDDNLVDCLNNDGQLKYAEEHMLFLPCNLEYFVDGTSEHIRLNGDVTLTFPYTDEYHTAITDFNVRGIALVNDGGYVMGMTINSYSLNISSEFTLENGLKLVTVAEGDYNG